MKFSEVEGMVELNSLPKIRVKRIKNAHCFELDLDATKFSPYSRYCLDSAYHSECSKGMVEYVSVPHEMRFLPLSESLKQPHPASSSYWNVLDHTSFNNPKSIHAGLLGLIAFYEKHSRLPALNNDSESEECLAFSLEAAKSVADIAARDLMENTIRGMARWARVEVTSLCASIGGVAAQEVLKFTGKYTPLGQWLHYGVLESVPSARLKAEPVLRGTRYDDYVAVFGEEQVGKWRKLRLFMVGAGALGCEMIKGLALMGVCAEGMLHCTDDDTIEPSNLNRQFLFGQDDIGKSKSATACKAGTRINPEFKYTTYKSLVTPATDDLFDEAFWESLDAVIGAVDNMDARYYVNSRCLWFNKPYLDSGTEGPSCHSLLVLSNLTSSYNQVSRSTNERIPMCTLRNTPSRIEHVIEWARVFFEETFTLVPQLALKFAKDPTEFLSEKKKTDSASGLIQTLEQIAAFAELKNASKALDGCAAYARSVFESKFNLAITQLLTAYPLDYKDVMGMPFWTRTKRAPQIATFDPKDQAHMNFILAFVRLMFRALRAGEPIGPEQAGKAIEAASLASAGAEKVNSRAVRKLIEESKDEAAKEQSVGKFDSGEEAAISSLFSRASGTPHDNSQFS